MNFGLQLHGEVFRVPLMKDPPWILWRMASYRWQTRHRKFSEKKLMKLRVELKTRRLEGIRDGLRQAVNPAKLPPRTDRDVGRVAAAPPEAVELKDQPRGPAVAPKAPAAPLKVYRPDIDGPVPVRVLIPTHGRPDLIVPHPRRAGEVRSAGRLRRDDRRRERRPARRGGDRRRRRPAAERAVSLQRAGQ